MMGKAKVTDRFPCGYEVTKERTCIFSTPLIVDDGKGCPLHGLKCVKSGGDK